MVHPKRHFHVDSHYLFIRILSEFPDFQKTVQRGSVEQKSFSFLFSVPVTEKIACPDCTNASFKAPFYTFSQLF